MKILKIIIRFYRMEIVLHMIRWDSCMAIQHQHVGGQAGL